MIVTTFSQVVMRNFYSTGILWFDPLARNLLLWIGFLGASVATYKKNHINIDALSKIFKGKSRHLMNITLALFACFICLVLANASYEFVKDTFQAGERIHQIFPTWIAQSIMPFSLAIMGLRFFKEFILQSFRMIKGYGPDLGAFHPQYEKKSNQEGS